MTKRRLAMIGATTLAVATLASASTTTAGPGDELSSSASVLRPAVRTFQQVRGDQPLCPFRAGLTPFSTVSDPDEIVLYQFDGNSNDDPRQTPVDVTLNSPFRPGQPLRHRYFALGTNCRFIMTGPGISSFRRGVELVDLQANTFEFVDLGRSVGQIFATIHGFAEIRIVDDRYHLVEILTERLINTFERPADTRVVDVSTDGYSIALLTSNQPDVELTVLRHGTAEPILVADRCLTDFPQAKFSPSGNMIVHDADCPLGDALTLGVEENTAADYVRFFNLTTEEEEFTAGLPKSHVIYFHARTDQQAMACSRHFYEINVDEIPRVLELGDISESIFDISKDTVCESALS